MNNQPCGFTAGLIYLNNTGRCDTMKGMKVLIKFTNLDHSESLKQYIDEKLSPLARLTKSLDPESIAELHVDVARTTRHHQKGEIFATALLLKLLKKQLRVKETDANIRVSIDRAKNTLKEELQKYKEKTTAKPRVGAKRILLQEKA